jgi:hypothetical protein
MRAGMEMTISLRGCSHVCTVLRESADLVEASQWAATPHTTVWSDEASVVFSG